MLTKNKYATHKNPDDKIRDFKRDCANGAMAYCSNDTKVPLSSLTPERVEFVAGLWRLQDPTPQNIQMVRDKPMVLIKRLPHTEKNLFEFYSACSVTQNCYGTYATKKPDYVVAKYTTDKGTYWAYGQTIEQARAFLGIRLYDEYMDLIHSVACKQTLSNQKK